MGLGIHQNGFRSAAGNQCFQNEAMAGITGAGIQLSVRKGACAALAELDIGFRTEQPRLPESGYIGAALLHRQAPLQKNGMQTAFGQHQSGKQPGGSRPDHHGGRVRRRERGGQRIHGRRIHTDGAALAAAQNRLFIPDPDRHGVYQTQRRAGIHCPAEHRQGNNGLLRQMQQMSGLFSQQRFRLAGGQLQLLQLQQNKSPHLQKNYGFKA